MFSFENNRRSMTLMGKFKHKNDNYEKCNYRVIKIKLNNLSQQGPMA